MRNTCTYNYGVVVNIPNIYYTHIYVSIKVDVINNERLHSFVLDG